MTQRNADPKRSSIDHIKHALRRALLSVALASAALAMARPATAAPCAAPQGGTCKPEPESDPNIEPKPEIEPEPEPENESKPEPEPENESDPKIENEPLVIPTDPQKALQGRALCTSAQLAAVEARWASSVVEVDGQFGFARGLLVEGGRYVLTQTEPVRYGRGFVIRGRGRTLAWTRIAAFDESSGLALIELEKLEPAPYVRWVEPAPSVGTPIVVMTGGYDANLGSVTEVSPGVIGGAPLSPVVVTLRAGAGGAPIFDCEGRVVGVSEAFVDTFVSAARARAIVERRDRLPDYEGEWSAAHFAFGLAVQVEGRPRPGEERRTYVGFNTGGAITAYDRLVMPYRFGLLVAAREQGQRTLEPTTELQGLKLQTELGLGYRFMLADAGFFTTYLVPQVGMAFGWERDVFVHRTPVVDAGCVDLSCPVTTDSVETRQSRWFWRPTLGVSLQASVFELGYSVQLETTALSASTHQIFLGTSF